MLTVLIISIIALLGISAVAFMLWKKHMFNWLPSYIYAKCFKKVPVYQDKPIHILFCFVDHFEPMRDTKDIEVERQRVQQWFTRYPELAKNHKDADGCFPKHSFFYPEEEYRFEHLDHIRQLCSMGFGEVEIHIHHDDDTDANFRKTLRGFIKTLDEDHGLLSRDPDGNLGFAFIHGNWALDNCHPGGLHCGINNEISLLREEGCFVDMTFPSAPHPTQPSTINSIYMATDDPDKPNSHDKGDEVVAGQPLVGDLLMVQGPLTLNWQRRKWGIMPRIENGDIRRSNPPSKERADLWVKQWIHVKDRPEWLIIKIHTHGVIDVDIDTLLGQPMDDLFTYMEEKYNDGDNYLLHYVSARELTNIIKAAADGHSGNPNDYRDYYYQQPDAITSAKTN